MNRTEREQQIQLLWALVFALLSALAITLFYKDAYRPLDETAFRIAEMVQTPWLTAVMKTITLLGDAIVVAPLGALIIIGFFLRGYRIEALIILVTLVAGNWLQDITKEIFARPRPDAFHLIALPESYSFPSGHAMVAVAFYGVLAYMLKRVGQDAPWRSWITPLYSLLLVGLCLSRIYLGVHYASDVLAGLCFSAVWYFLVRYVYNHAVNVYRPSRHSLFK
ncbi:phosphatase PAP2 family protein [Brevibacillus fulvus]|uniref:Undecaprenyl-diphosphatase n=1 Tax=Brevibacillus fulvus TaxID=1125967 RepID=A0A938XV42_9BACL|nr:phosphatase PAP2 family protein [Brevibacillus fulvus]MBM7588521.1 undecaprenyl-diphosphatase [Brevibacillus fulvus]